MNNILFSTIKLPPYEGLEISYEDIVYSYFRTILNERGYSFKVKRTGFSEIDLILPSRSSGNKGRGQCDGYIFSGNLYQDFFGLIELESTGNIEYGVNQIRTYVEGFVDDTLTNSQRDKISKISKRDIILIVYDGQRIYLSEYNLDKKIENIIINSESISQLPAINEKLFSLFPLKEIIEKDIDEKNIIETVAKLIRGHENLQKNKAILMTVLASIYGVTKKDNLPDAIEILKQSQVDYEKKIYGVWNDLQNELNDQNDRDKENKLYAETASQMYRLSQDKGMDLYGFIYEELATKANKKEQGEYYTPRHTIKPIISAVFSYYLNWKEDELDEKIVFDPFVGSAGFLYEYIHLLKTKFNLGNEKLNDIAKRSIYGCDKNSILASYLNLFLIGDGDATIKRVKTSINWRTQFLYKTNPNPKKKYGVTKIDDKSTMDQNLRSYVEDIEFLLKMYIKKDVRLNVNELSEYLGESDPLNIYIY
jgi:hypothetical protein